MATAGESPGNPRDEPDAGAELLDLAVYNEHGATVVAVIGELDMLTTPLLESRVIDELAEGPAALVLDLSGVTFLGSSGLALLVQTRERATERGIRLRLVAGSQPVNRPLTATGLDSLFDIVDSRDAALEGLT